MSADWTHTTLGAIADGTNGAVDGPFGSNLKASSYSDSGVPVIRGSNLSIGLSRFDSSEFVYVSEETLERLKRSECLPGDIVFTKKGTLGQTGFISNDLKYKKYLLSSNQMRLRVNTSIADPEYVYYWVSSNESIEKIKRDSEFTGVPKINLDYLKKFPIKLPTLESQKAAASILRSIDNKIHLNTQTNQILESIAQAIFKSWFVDFEPVKAKMAVLAEGGTHEQAELAAMGAISGKSETELAQLQQQNPEHYQQLAETATLFPSAMVESELGEIPEGWEVSEIGNEVDIVGGGTPSTTEPSFWEDGEIHWTTPKDLSNNKSKVLLNTERKITEAGLAKISSGLLPVNTVLMSSRAPVGYLALAKVPVAVNQGYIAMKCNSTLPSEYVILWAESVMDEIQQRASGTTFAEISKKTFRVIPLVRPTQKLAARFKEMTSEIFNKIAATEKQSQQLAELRDSLLPKLLSGEIDLSDIQSEVA